MLKTDIQSVQDSLAELLGERWPIEDDLAMVRALFPLNFRAVIDDAMTAIGEADTRMARATPGRDPRSYNIMQIARIDAARELILSTGTNYVIDNNPRARLYRHLQRASLKAKGLLAEA